MPNLSLPRVAALQVVALVPRRPALRAAVVIPGQSALRVAIALARRPRLASAIRRDGLAVFRGRRVEGAGRRVPLRRGEGRARRVRGADGPDPVSARERRCNTAHALLLLLSSSLRAPACRSRDQ